MILLGAHHKQAWSHEVKNPRHWVRREPVFKAAFPLKEYPQSHNEEWSAKRFIEAGFPANPLPKVLRATSSVSLQGMHNLREEREKVKPFSEWEEEVFNKLTHWIEFGVPDDSKSFPPSLFGKHHLSSEELKLAIDSISKFCDKKFIIGPIDKEDYPFDKCHAIGLFVREQKNASSVRVIYDCSSPKEEEHLNINFHNNPAVQLRYPYSMAQANDIILEIIDHGWGEELEVLKADLSDAFKNLGVDPSTFWRQCFHICSTFFLDMRLLFGESNSPHRFVFFHKSVQDLFVFPHIRLKPQNLHLAIDDSSLVTFKRGNRAREYYDRYKYVINSLGMKIKENDPECQKAFEPSDHGNVLGVNIDLPSRTWSVPLRKLEDMSQSLDDIVDKTNPLRPIAFSVNQFERCIGILESFSRLSAIGRNLLLVPRAEMAWHLARFNEQNYIKPEQQTKYCSLTHFAKLNILQFRALLMISPQHGLPFEDTRRAHQNQGAVDFAWFSDASGLPKAVTAGEKYRPTCLGLYVPANISYPVAEALAFPLPYGFLVSKTIGDGKGDPKFLCDQMLFLELLPALCGLLQSPAKYRRKSIILYTDNQATAHMFNNCQARQAYTAYVLEALNFVLGALGSRLVMKWRRRRSDFPTEVADDLTHADFSRLDNTVNCQIVSLPGPLYKVIHHTTSHSNHLFHTLKEEIKVYLSRLFTDIVFPWE